MLWGVCPLPCKILSSFPDLCPLETTTTLPPSVMQNKNVSRYCHMSPGVQINLGCSRQCRERERDPGVIVTTHGVCGGDSIPVICYTLNFWGRRNLVIAQFITDKFLWTKKKNLKMFSPIWGDFFYGPLTILDLR